MRVLLLTEGYPPEPVVGALRAGNVARALARAGHRVTVVASCAGHHAPGDVFRDGPIEVNVVGALPGLKSVLARTRNLFLPWSPRSPGQSTSRAEAPQSEKGGILKELSDLLAIPDNNQGWIPVAVRNTLRKAAEGIDLLYSTSPSHSTQVAALLAGISLDCPWIAEFRDPWTDNGMLMERSRKSPAARLDLFLERAVVRRADLVVAVSESAGDLFADKIGPDGRSRVRVVMNGVERLLAERPPRRLGPLRLVFSGSMYYPRDPVPLLSAFARAAAERRAEWEVRFIGHCRQYGDVDIAELCQQLRLRAIFRDWASPDEARDEVEHADLLLLPTQGWIHQIPNKLFDYLGARTPVLALCERGNESARLLERAGGHYVVYTDALEDGDGIIRRAIECAAARPSPGDEAYLQTLTVERQMQALVREVESCVAARRAR